MGAQADNHRAGSMVAERQLAVSNDRTPTEKYLGNKPRDNREESRPGELGTIFPIVVAIYRAVSG